MGQEGRRGAGAPPPGAGPAQKTPRARGGPRYPGASRSLLNFMVMVLRLNYPFDTLNDNVLSTCCLLCGCILGDDRKPQRYTVYG